LKRILYSTYHHHQGLQFEQEAQLLQRDRATLRVIEYFAKSPKVTQDHSK